MAVPKEARKFKDEIADTIRWSATSYNYLKLCLQRIERLVADPSNKRFYSQAKSKYRYANRAEYRMGRHYTQCKKIIDELLEKNILSDDDKQKLEGIKERLRPNEAVLIREGSYFIGRLEDDFDAVGVQIDLLRGGDQNQQVVLHLVHQLIEKIKEFIAEPEKGIPKNVGLVPFIAILEKELKPFAKNL